MEFKLLQIDFIDIKFDEGKPGTFSGYASVFNGVDSYGDTIVQGAYKKTLKGRKRPVQLRFMHYGPIVGKITKLVEDDKGLYIEGELTPGHRVAQDVYASMKHGAINGLSIGYRPVKIEEPEPGKRLLKEIDLIEISIVEEPADLNARVGGVKSFTDKIDDANTPKDFEAILCETGFSNKDATAFVSRLRRSMLLGEREKKRRALAESIRKIQI